MQITSNPRPGASHRPYPLPRSPWIMNQVWHNLLFAHWPVPVSVLRRLVPSCLELDTYKGEAWTGLVPFTMSGVTARFVPPLPWFSAFPELNFRTYVHVGGHPGVYFFSLDAANRVAVQLARSFYQLPYYHAKMAVDLEGDSIHYSSTRLRPQTPPAQLQAIYRPAGPVFHPEPASIEYWLTERYCLYTTSRYGKPLRCEIHHGPWPLQAAVATIKINTIASAAGILLPDIPPLLHFSKRQDVQIWPLLNVVATGNSLA